MARSADRLGPFTPNHTSMGLDCYPKACRCSRGKQAATNIPQWMTHPENAPCPFAEDNFPIGMVGTCCSLRGKVAADELEALGEDDLAGRMYEDMTVEEGLAFAEQLRAAADRLEHEHEADATKPKGAGWNGTWDKKRKTWVYQDYSTFEEALAAIREAARWYEKVGKLDFEVTTWA